MHADLGDRFANITRKMRRGVFDRIILEYAHSVYHQTGVAKSKCLRKVWVLRRRLFRPDQIIRDF